MRIVIANSGLARQCLDRGRGYRHITVRFTWKHFFARTCTKVPELPEVQTLVNDLNAAGLAGVSFTGARVSWPRSVATPGLRDFRRRIRFKTIGAIRRRGKFLVFDLAPEDHLLIHLRMSGRLHLVPRGTARSPTNMSSWGSTPPTSCGFTTPASSGACFWCRTPLPFWGDWDPNRWNRPSAPTCSGKS